MEALTPIASLEYFEENLPNFLSGKDKITYLTKELKENLSDGSEEFHANILKSGKKLIKYILTESIDYLSEESKSPKNKSIKSINQYIDAFVLFEEMLFGLNPKYRDHTLHSLWVYLFGHQWIIKLGGYENIKIAGQININFFKGGKLYFVLATNPIKCSKEHLEAMWGMIAILHDLGYPVEAISNRPGEIFGQILEPFAIDFSSFLRIDFGSRISLLHDSICEVLASMYRPKELSDDEERQTYADVDKKVKEGHILPILVLRKPDVRKAEALEMEFRIASVDKIHSAWSSILAFKNITYLHESDYFGGGGRDYLKLLTKRDILYSIVHHTAEEPKDNAVNRFQFILLIVDDIEEAARYSKGGQERGLKSDYCDLRWDVDETKMRLELDFTEYKNGAQLKYEELSNKYKAQIADKGKDKKYDIEICFIDKDFRETLNMCLKRD